MSRWFSQSMKWYGAGAAEINEATKTALLEIAADLQMKSRDEAPIDHGDLRDDCTIDESELDRGVVKVGYSLPYALKQHEELGYHHNEGKAKFLEDPFNANVKRYQELIGAKIFAVVAKKSFAKGG